LIQILAINGRAHENAAVAGAPAAGINRHLARICQLANRQAGGSAGENAENPGLYGFTAR
jgi:hypothetical protein